MSTRLHIVVSDDLLARIDHARGADQPEPVPRSVFVRRAVEQALRGQTMGSPCSVEAASQLAAPAEQPRVFVKRDPSTGGITAKLPDDSAFGRVRSSAEARPFRPAPKKGQK